MYYWYDKTQCTAYVNEPLGDVLQFHHRIYPEIFCAAEVVSYASIRQVVCKSLRNSYMRNLLHL